MIANAEQAVETLRHKRTGEVLPTKNIANNTKLVYYADELVGLQFHRTVIAMYRTDGVVIDVRGPGSLTGEGWFTPTTWQRIDDWTPVRTQQREGVRWILDGDGEARLYAHGLHVSPDGSCDFPFDDQIERAIAKTIRNFPRRVHRNVDRVIANWQDWQQPQDCCVRAYHSEQFKGHMLEHVERSEAVIPPGLSQVTADLRARGFYGAALVEQLRTYLRDSFSDLTQLAVKTLAPEFPYPQVTRT